MSRSQPRQTAGSEPRRLVVVGASLAGLRAVESARRNGFAGEIVLVGDEIHLPYDRPPLTKEFLTETRAPAFFHPADHLTDDLDVQLRLGRRAVGLDIDSRGLVLADEETIGYDRLIIATGAVPRRPDTLPDTVGVVTIRTLDDALTVRSLLTPGRRVVIVGAGLIGSELASSARTLGANVVLIDAAPVPLVRAVGTEVGRRLTSLHAQHGTELSCDVTVTAVEHHGDRVAAVRLSDGQRLPADLVVVSVGAQPATTWLASSGVALNATDGAVICDGTLETSVPGIFAAGDVAEWPNALVGGRARQENWSNAAGQGASAGRNAVAAQPSGYESVPYFWSDWYGQRIQFAGTAVDDKMEFRDLSGDRGGFIGLFGRDDRLVGVATCNGQRLIMKFRRHIHDRMSFSDAVASLSTFADVA